MMDTGTWRLVPALLVALAAPLAVAATPQSGSDHRSPRQSVPANRAQSPIGRALAGLLQQASAPPTTAPAPLATALDAPRDASGDRHRMDDASKHASEDTQTESVEVAVH